MTSVKAKRDQQRTMESASGGPLLERMLGHCERHGLRREGLVLVWLVLLLLRWLVGLHSYSGAGNPPMFGDYEAQRHWMEITINLPIGEWYFNSSTNDLLYWGLDYPPLTAYVSYVFGLGATLVEPELVALTASHGYESPTSKVFMRTSVILCDALLLFPAIFAFVRLVAPKETWGRKMVTALLILGQPGLVLIDHGHFQYNNVCLGFTTLALVLLWRDHEFLGGIAFCLALNFKQMALYYAPAVGVFLFSKCMYRAGFFWHFIKLGIAVILTFAILWFPFCLWHREDSTCGASIAQVLHRIFPFARGLFEDKVANVWCVADLVLKLKRRVAPALQMRLCTLGTVMGFLPSVVDLLRRKPSNFRFLLALANSSLSFFLFSFQVHEKSILLPLLPIALLHSYNPLLSGWFGCMSTFSMYFLLKKDGLILAYVVLQSMHFAIAICPYLASVPSDTVKAPVFTSSDRWIGFFVISSILGAFVIHVLQAVMTPPERYPHIFDYIFATYSCAHFLGALAYCTYWQWTSVSDDSDPSLSKNKVE